MKIERIETFFYHPASGKNLLFCKITADDGTYGWGESYVGLKKEKVVQQYLQAMAPYIVGREPTSIRHTAQVMFDDFAIRRSSLDFFCAWSAVELALWDIVGKIAGLPVHKLLGGACRESVRLYASGWWYGANDIDTTVERGLELQKQGYTALKWDPFPGPWRTHITRQEEDYAIANVRAMREALGADMELMIDVHRRLAPHHAIRTARRMEEYDISCIEEPCLSDNIELVAQVRRGTSIPIVTGETLYTKEEFARVFASGAADILNPDICAVGGITQMLEIAAMAHPHGVAISPHNYNSTIVGLAATVHFSALIQNFTIAECFVNLKAPCDYIMTQGVEMKEGWAALPDAPGWGVDIDVERLLERPYKDYPHKNLRQYWEEFPRKNYVWGEANVSRSNGEAHT